MAEWLKASTVGGPVAQVGNKPILFVLIDNPISQSVMFFFLSLPIAIANGSTWFFSIHQNQLHAETFRFRWSIGSVRRVNLQISSCLTCATFTMLRVWMLLVVGAAAMRQVAEDVSAHSAVEEGPFSYFTNMWETSSLRSAAEEVAKKNFPEFERQDLIEEVMKAHQNGELDKGLEEKSWEEKQRYLLTTMQTMEEEYLRSAAEEVAKKNFPKKEREKLTESVMEAFKNGELVKDVTSRHAHRWLLHYMKNLRELPVAASAVKFCSNLFREANKLGQSELFREVGDFEAIAIGATQALEEADEAAGICHKVLTGELGAHDGPEWAEKAANSSQPEGQHYQLGRLEKVNATEKAWKVSLDNVCKDECQELVKEMIKKARYIMTVVNSPKKPPSYEEVCARHVVQKVEAEILGCCAESCGWNGRACMYWPFLNGTEKGQWEAECCTEFNILKNSSRATMCDATLTGKENNEVIRDEQPNNEEEREMIGQDPVLKGTSFFEREDTNGPSPPPDNKPIPAPEGTCPPPLDLGKIHEKLKHEWKTTNYQLAKNNFPKPICLPKRLKDSIRNCTAFLPQDENSTYMCYADCLVSGEGLKFTNLTAEILSNSQLLYVHETIYKK